MPRLNHKKARTGCQRCKARKVKCDEGKPRCSACEKHNVSCEYAQTAPRSTYQQALPSPPTDLPPGGSYDVVHTSRDGVNDRSPDSKLELRLMHEWTAHTSQTFSTASEFWRFQVPLIALDFRYVLDALLAMAALHASRRPPNRWLSLEGRMVQIRNPIFDPAHPEREKTYEWKKTHEFEEQLASTATTPGSSAYVATHSSLEMLSVSRAYFDRALDGHMKAVANMTPENIEAVTLTSILVSLCALFTLRDSEQESLLPANDPAMWLRLAKGTPSMTKRWYEFVGPSWIISSGLFYGEPDLTDEEELFSAVHRKPFGRLLTWAQDFETMTSEDTDAYMKTLSFIGTIYKGIVEGTDVPIATCRRLSALPSRCPPRFTDLVDAKRPRALAMLAHVFSSMKLIEDKVEWCKGVAERQVPKIYEQLPVGWHEMMSWPMAIARGEVHREPVETQIDDVSLL